MVGSLAGGGQMLALGIVLVVVGDPSWSGKRECGAPAMPWNV